MKILWAAMLGLTAAAWAFEGDWSAWDKPDGVENATRDDAVHGAPGSGTEAAVYQLRTLGRGESRWMGRAEGESPSLGDLDGMSRFDLARRLGRAEAYHIDGSVRTAPYLADIQVPASETLTGKESGCDLVEANRAEGRDEARVIKVRPDGTGEQPTTWEMDEASERKAAAKAAGSQDC